MNSQKQKILDHLKKGGAITPMEALMRYGCYRLGARICELRNEGYDISTDLQKHYAIYTLRQS